MTADEYEVLLADIVKGMQESSPGLSGEVVGCGRKNRIPGASGYKHQIDVSLDLSYKELNKFFIIECKRWKEKIGAAPILVLASRTKDIQEIHPSCTVTSIMASVEGVTGPGCKLAEHFGIQIEIVKSGHEFGLRLGKFIHEATSVGLNLSDEASITLKRNGEIVDDT